MAEEIIAQIKSVCEQHGVPEPDIFTEFGSYTVGEVAQYFTQYLIKSSRMTVSYGT